MSDDVHTMTGAYALDALTDGERVVVERHLAVCETCVREVAEFRETVTRLGVAAATGAPPRRLRGAVLGAIRGTRQRMPRGPGSRGRLGGARRLALVLTSAAASALLAATTVLGVSVAHAGDERAAVAGRLAEAGSILRADDLRVVRADAASGGGVAVVLTRERGRAMLLTDLPPAPDGHAHQAWLVDRRIRSAGLVEPSDMVFLDLPDGGGAARLTVTVEPAAGSPRPTTPPLASMPLTVP